MSEEQIEYTGETPDYSNNEEQLTDKLSELLSDNQEEEEVEELPEEVIPEVVKPTVPEDTLVKIKVNGEEKEVPLSELKNGYQRQADYTNKTQELSVERQQIEQQKQQWDQYVNAIPTLANTAVMNIEQANAQLYSPEFIRLASEDPAAYIAQKAQLESVLIQNQNSLEQMRHHWEQTNYERQNQQTQHIQQELQASSEKLAKEFGEDWTSGKLQHELFDYGVKQGLDVNILNSITDANVLIQLNKARLYDELMANKDITSKRVDKIPPKVIQSNSKNEPDTTFADRKTQALRSNNSDDIAKLISELL